MRSLAYLASEIFFYLGDLVSRIIQFLPQKETRFNDVIGAVFVGVYSWFMRRSYLLSEKYNLNVWREEDA